MSTKRSSPGWWNSGERCTTLRWSVTSISSPGRMAGSMLPDALVCTSTFTPSAARVRMAPFMPSGSPVSYACLRPASTATGRPPSVPSRTCPAWPPTPSTGKAGRSRYGMSMAPCTRSASGPQPVPSTTAICGKRPVARRRAVLTSMVSWKLGFISNGPGRSHGATSPRVCSGRARRTNRRPRRGSRQPRIHAASGGNRRTA